MLGRLLAPFVARRRRKATPSASPTPVVPASPPAPRVSVVRAAEPEAFVVAESAASPVADPPASPEAPLRAHLAEKVHELIDELPANRRRADYSRLLRSLLDGSELTIRQPPAAFQQALALSRREDVGLGEIVRVIERDPVLSQGALQHASSAFYSRGGGPCRSVNAAAQRIGAAGLHGVVVGAMMRAVLLRPGAAHAAMVSKVWDHLVRTAGIARDLAGAFAVQPEQAYTVGLLHDVGKLVLFDRLSTARAELRRELDVPAPALHRALRALHEPLGGLATLRWELGGTVARAIATHHREPAPDYRDALGELAFVAERIDLLRLRKTPIDVDALCDAGHILVPRAWLAASVAGIAYAA